MERNIGRVPWNKGLKTGPLSQETKMKLSKIHKGKPKPKTITQRLKQSESMIGKTTAEKNGMWIGGNGDWWAKELKKIYKDCVLCKSTKNLHCHHRDGDRSNNIRENFIIICGSCHRFWHDGCRIQIN